MKAVALAALFLFQGAAEVPGLGRLPAWAQGPAREAAQETPPAGADAWVLLSRREIGYGGDGVVRVREFRLVKLIRGRGLEEAGYVRRGLLDGAERIRDLKGWNLRPDGEMVKLEARDKATFGDVSQASFDRRTAQVAQLRRATEGSLVAFEVEEEVGPLKDPWTCPVMEAHPVRRWELDASARDGGTAVQVRRLRFRPWVSGGGEEGPVQLAQVPPQPLAEPACPFPHRQLPAVEVRFLDPRWTGTAILASWDNLGGWYHGIFAPKVQPVAGEGQGLAGLRAIWRRLGRDLVYKQVYLSPARSNVPETSVEVARKGYGDCKDLTCLFLAQARAAGFEGYPVLARMQVGPILESEIAGPPRDTFDHVLAALRLEAPLGLEAEVVTPKGRFLLVDPTDPFTPLGRLGTAHRDGRLLICLPGGGQWVAVPQGAVAPGSVEISLKGKVDAGGGLEAEARLVEAGGLWGLRSRAKALTRDDFRAYVEAEVLDQAINGKVEVLALGDPLDLERPFAVTLKLAGPGALGRQGAAWVLRTPLGLPGMPPAFAPMGRKRQLPVVSRRTGRVVLDATLELPGEARPILAESSGETPFRALAWKASLEPGGRLLRLRVEESRKDAAFGLADLAAAEVAWRKDRALVRSLLEDGMAFRP